MDMDMATERPKRGTATVSSAPVSTPPPVQVFEDSFNYTLPNGDIIECGRPPGVLKLRLRDLLTGDLMQDAEMVQIATAFLSIRTINGIKLWIRNYNEFEGLLSRFGSDEGLDRFVKQFMKLTQPGRMEIIDRALDEALDKGLKPEAITEYVAEAAMKYEREQRKRLQDS
jgi:hypothetical protein